MQTIDIRTTQNVTIEYELASLRERALSFFVDFLITIVIYLGVFILLRSILPDSLFETGMLEMFWLVLLPIAFIIFYQFLSELLGNGRSWGKRALGIKVVRIDGLEPGLSDYFIRAVFHIVDSLMSSGVLAGLLISSSPKQQRLGDMAANTTVIRVRPNARFQLQDILKISSIEDYQPRYPEVRRLSEQDMLLLKHLIARQRQYRNEAHDEAIDEAVAHITSLLQIKETPHDNIEFLKTLIRDYIVLTR